MLRTLLAFIAGISVANIVYNQPLLECFRASFPENDSAIGLVPMVTSLGYAVGMMLLAPLGDKLDRRLIILLQIFFLSISLLLTAMAATLWVVVAASAAIGVFSTIAQQAVPFAAELAPTNERGAAVGIVMTGVLLGILLGRTFAGIIAHYFGWRAVFSTSVVFLVFSAIIVYRKLPHSTPTTKLPYLKLLVSMWALFSKISALRQASFTGASIFAAFSAFWPALTLLLVDEPFHLGPPAAGLFGLAGAAGALCAPYVGRMADKKGTRLIVTLGIALVILSFMIIMALRNSLVGLTIGVIVLDIGVQSAMVANQTRVYALDLGARSRLNTVYMTCYFIGGALGAWAGVASWNAAGWTGVCVVGLVFGLASAAIHLLSRR
ncbi:MFS transporter [Pseudomonas aeruginosa]